MTTLDVLVAWLLVIALCGALWALACVIEDGLKGWKRFWKRDNWRRNGHGWLRWKA